MVRTVAISFVCLIFLFSQISAADMVWQAQNSGVDDLDIRSISVFAKNNNFICAASEKRLYFSENAGELWQEIFSLQGEVGEINFVTFDFADPMILYLATTKGLYASKNQGQTWQRIFRSARETANNVSWIALDSKELQKIYIGTEEGLFVSDGLGRPWQKASGGLPHTQVRSFAIHPSNSGVLYLANNLGLYKSIDQGLCWERIYLTSQRFAEEKDEQEDSAQKNETGNLINCVAIDQAQPKRIFLATGAGPVFSDDAGESWHKMPSQGLSSDYLNFIVVSEYNQGAVYAATKGGVFIFLPAVDRWQEIYQGMTARQIHSLALNEKARLLFAGTDKGVFKTIEVKNTPGQGKPAMITEQKSAQDPEQLLNELTLNEPTIAELQEAALRYAEVVHPNRIKALRKNAKLKALLPDVSIDYDKTINYDSGADRYYVGPYDWGFTLSWDVGDLVFSEQVRLLDSNARLMVQLRDDIINEITRLYYARRQLQTELILSPPKNTEQKLAKTLRLEELTANIDGLTGGYFSRHLKDSCEEKD